MKLNSLHFPYSTVATGALNLRCIHQLAIKAQDASKRSKRKIKEMKFDFKIPYTTQQLYKYMHSYIHTHDRCISFSIV